MTKPVYDYRKDGLRFRLYPDGNISVSSKDLPERRLAQLQHESTGEPWIPKHKNFNNLCREMIREGDVDDVLSAQARISRERGMKRNAGVELYDALEDLVHQVDRPGAPEWLSLDDAFAALAKARGE